MLTILCREKVWRKGKKICEENIKGILIRGKWNENNGINMGSLFSVKLLFRILNRMDVMVIS